jgi:hypothetical protein
MFFYAVLWYGRIDRADIRAERRGESNVLNGAR